MRVVYANCLAQARQILYIRHVHKRVWNIHYTLVAYITVIVSYGAGATPLATQAC